MGVHGAGMAVALVATARPNAARPGPSPTSAPPMIPASCQTVARLSRCPDAALAMKSLHSDDRGLRGPARAGVGVGGRRRGDLGFSMIELMVVLAVVALLAVVAAVGFRRNEFANLRAHFVADVEGAVVQARNAAVDRQTQVRVVVDRFSVTITAFDTSDDTWRPVDRVSLVDGAGTFGSAGTLIAADTGTPIVCVFGLTPGVHAPSQTATVDPPDDCVAGTQTLVFEPDGRFSDPDGTFSGVPNAGATLWIADRTLTTGTKYSIVQIYPGGLVRTFEQLD